MFRVYKWSIPNHFVVMIAGWVGKIITALAQLVCIRLVISSIGIEHYAPFALTVAMIGWFTICDLGLGASLQNYISEANVTKKDVGHQIITVCALLILLWVILNSVFFVLSYWLGSLYFQGSSFLSLEEQRMLFFLGCLSGVSFVIGGAVYKVYFAWHKGYLSNLIPAVLSVCALCLVYFALIGDKGLLANVSPVVILSFCWLVPVNVVPVILFFKLFFKYARYIKHINLKQCWTSLKRGQGFFLFSVMATLTLQVDYIIISQVLSNYYISLYNVASKIFSLIFFFYNALLMAIWPVICEKLKDHQWYYVKNLLSKNIRFGTLLVMLSTLFFIIFRVDILNLLAPKSHLVVPVSLILLFCLYYVIRVWCDSYALILNSTSKMKPFLVLVPFQAGVSIIFQVIGAKSAGLTGLLTGLILSFLLTVFWGLPYAVSRYKQQWIKSY